MSTYPADLETDVALRDGRTVHVRPVQVGDEDSIAMLLRGMSERSRRFRFFSSMVDPEAEARRATEVDYRDSYGVVALLGEDHVVGHASYNRIDSDRAEVAFSVADEFQGLGLGSIMLVGLAEHAVEQGVPLLEAEVMPENHRMLTTFRESGRPLRMRTEPGLITAELPSSLSEPALERFESREQLAACAAVAHFLCPSEIAVITPESPLETLADELRGNVLYGGFVGTVHDLRPGDPVPDRVELAVASLEPNQLLDTARRCAAAGVRALIAAPSGSPHALAADQRSELIRICRTAGMRLLGPECLGVVNTDPEARLNASYATELPPAGTFAFMSQSDAIGLAAMKRALARGLGMSSLVSVGDRGDISSNDLLHWWEAEERTSVIGLYLESFGNPRKFARLARRVGRKTPIVAVKSGRTAVGARASASHAGGVISASDVNVEALFSQAGIIRTDTIRELFDAALLLSTQPLPRGRRVAVLTNAGGPGVLCADACSANGLEVPDLDHDVAAQLRRVLGDELPAGNPVHLPLVGSPRQYHDAILTLGHHPSIDAVCAVYVPPLGRSGRSVMQAMRAAAVQLPETPLLAVLMLDDPEELRGHNSVAGGASRRVPVYDSPGDAARALGRVARYAQWRARPDSPHLRMSADKVGAAAAVIAGALRAGPGWLGPADVARLLACGGLRVDVAPAALPPGLDMHAGVVADPLFGPVLGLGVGEPANEVLRDVAVRITPVSHHDAAQLVRSLRSFPLLDGHGGRPKLDVAELERLLQAVSALVEDLPQVVEVELDPLRVTTDGVLILGARIRVEDVGHLPSLIARSQG